MKPIPYTLLDTDRVLPNPLLADAHQKILQAMDVAIEQRLDSLILEEDPSPYLALFIAGIQQGPPRLHSTIPTTELLLVNIRAAWAEDYDEIVKEVCREYGGGRLIPIRAEGQWTSPYISGLRH